MAMHNLKKLSDAGVKIGFGTDSGPPARFQGYSEHREMELMVQSGLKLMDRQHLEWPRVAVNQVTEVPRHLARSAWLFFTDRERLVREGP